MWIRLPGDRVDALGVHISSVDPEARVQPHASPRQSGEAAQAERLSAAVGSGSWLALILAPPQQAVRNHILLVEIPAHDARDSIC
jgi:hypothetical protein